MKKILTNSSVPTILPPMNDQSPQPDTARTSGRSGKTRRTRSERRTLATRKKILDAARVVFAEKGINQARIDDITERADIGKGTFYNYFRTKESLVGVLMANVLTDLNRVINQNCQNAGNLTELLDSLIATHIRFFSDRWEDFVLFFQGRTDLILQEGYQGIEAPFIDYLAQVEHLIAAVMHHGLPPNVLRRMACAVAGLVSGYYSFAVIASKDDDIDTVFKSLRGAMVASLVRFITEAVSSAEKEKNERGIL